MNIIKKYEYPNDLTNVNLVPNWVVYNPGNYECEKNANGENTGRQLQAVQDMNYYSDSFQIVKKIVFNTNFTVCPLPAQDCGDPRYKWINAACQKACRENISSVYQRVTDPMTGFQKYKWICTWRYRWTDGSYSQNFTEENDAACTISTLCEE